MKTFTRTLNYLILVIILICPLAVSQAEEIKLKVFSLPSAYDVSVSGKADRAVLRAFEEKYPDIELSSFSGIKIAGAAMDVGPLMAIAGGVSPDVIYVNFRQSDSYINQGFLYPLDEYIKDIPEGELKDRVLPAVEAVIHREGQDRKKHWWCLPTSNFVVSLLYRKDLFQDAGIDPDSPPRDWKELLFYCHRLTDPEKGIYGFGVDLIDEFAWHWYTFLLSAGGGAVERNEDGEWRAVFNTPEAVESAYFFCQMMQGEFTNRNGQKVKGCVYWDTDMLTKATQGKVAIWLSYLTDELIASVNPEQIGIAPVPLGPTGLRGSELNCAMMGIFAGIKDKKVRDAAFKFIWFWNGSEAKAIRTKIFVENGYGKFLNPSYLKKYGFHDYLKKIPKGWEKTFDDAMANGVPEPYGKNCQVVYRHMSRPLQQMLAEGLGGRPKENAKDRIKQLLDEGVRTCNEKMIGVIPQDEMSKRRKVALMTAIAIVVSFGLVFFYLMKIFTPEYTGEKKSGQFWKYRVAYLILIPAVASVLLWQYFPLIRGVTIAFMDYRIMGGSKFIGLDNFANILFDPFFWKCLWNTLCFTILWITMGFLAPIILAVLLTEVPRGKIFLRAIYYLPAVISGLVVMFMWKSFFDPSPTGLLNKLLTPFGVPAQGWLKDPRLAMFCVILPTVWAGMGPGCLIYLAALKSVPEELYEAADVDGAGTWSKIIHIAMPTIRPLIIINLVGAFIAACNTTDFVLVMTGGGPNYATHVLGLEIFYNAFLYLKFGIATAMAWILGFILIGFTVYQMKRLSQMEFKAAGTGIK